MDPKDFVDCFVAIFPEIKYIYLFGQSSRYCKVRLYGLVAKKINDRYGGNNNKFSG